MCSIFDTEDIALKRPSTNVALKGKHKVCSILDIVHLALEIVGRGGGYTASIRREVFVNTDCLLLVLNCG